MKKLLLVLLFTINFISLQANKYSLTKLEHIKTSFCQDKNLYSFNKNHNFHLIEEKWEKLKQIDDLFYDKQQNFNLSLDDCTHQDIETIRNQMLSHVLDC